MTHGLPARVGRFVLVFLMALAAVAALWSFVSPTYTRGIAALARPLFRLMESPNVTVLDVQGAETWIYRIVGEHEIAAFTWFDRYTFFAIVPLIALFVATPGLRWRRRIVRGLLGIGALSIVHVGYVVASVELAYAAMGLRAVGPLAARTLDGWQITVRVLWEAAPIAIWVALTYGAWKKVFAQLRNEERAEGTARASWIGALGALGWKKKEGTP